jgi:hypothetical protein
MTSLKYYAILKMDEITTGQEDQTNSLIFSIHYMEVMECVKELKKAKNISLYDDESLCMYISSHLDRKNVPHSVVKGIFYKSKAFYPLELNEKEMIVPITSEVISLSIVMPIKSGTK